MKKRLYFLLLFAISLLFVQCQEEDTEPEPPQVEEPKEDYEFRLRLLNENLEEATEFEHGKNIIFSFLMTNNTDKTIYMYRFDNPDFLRVYQKQEGATKDINHGLHYDYFLGINNINLTLRAKKVTELKVPWVYSTNIDYHTSGQFIVFEAYPEKHQTYLEKGEYYISFKQSFLLYYDDINEVKIGEKSFYYKFTVK